ncbi:N-acetyltransferase [Prolixibacteraceae bacterium JC049]|nr:N-acetyltransferase [Prolixibacteraceae bacterium JC049]
MNALLSNEKVMLRPVEPEDLEILYRWENDSNIWHVSNTLTPFSRFIIAEYIKSSAQDIYTTKQLRLMIENHNGETVGTIDLFDFDPFHLRAGVGILIQGEKNKRQGFAAAALDVLASYCKKHLGLIQLYANITDNNTASMHLFEKAGYQLSGTKKNWIRSEDQWFDEHIYQLMF